MVAHGGFHSPYPCAAVQATGHSGKRPRLMSNAQTLPIRIVRRRSSVGAWLLIAALAAISLATPIVGNNYYNSFMFFLFIAIVMASTYDVVAGYTGYINLGH